MIETTDQLGNTLRLPAVPRRIVSLVPSQTELLFDLGVGDAVVGVTRYCVHPADGVAGLPRIGGTKRFHFDRIERLRPDLVIGNKEENYPEGILRLRGQYPVWMSDIATLDGALQMIREVGRVVGRDAAANDMSSRIATDFAALAPGGSARPGVAYLIWREPWMVAGAGTFIDELLGQAGLCNVFADRQRYPEVSLGEIRAQRPAAVLLSSEPYPFDAAHAGEIRAVLPDTRVLCVDGTLFSWYGSRLLRSAAYLARIRGRCSGP